MKISEYKSYDDLPLFLNAATVAKVLGIAPSSTYELMHEADFPVLKIGNRLVVPKEKFIQWVEQHTRCQSMRKYHVPFGWPRRDPRHSRFPLPNAVWEYQLKPIAFVILSYLCCHSSHGGTRVLTPEVIAKGIHKTEDTVRKYLSDLEDAGLVSGQYSIAADFLSAESGKFFTLPTEIFLLNLPPAAFMVYAYLLLIEDRRTHTCHPSYNTIAATTGMSKNTVIKAINVLLEKHLVTLEHSQYLDQSGMKWNGNNLYTILPTQSAVDAFHQRQLCHLELEAQQRKLRRRQEHRACQATPSTSASGTFVS